MASDSGTVIKSASVLLLDDRDDVTFAPQSRLELWISFRLKLTIPSCNDVEGVV
jgi:hypothetical protein